MRFAAPIGLALGCLAGLAIFGLAEAVHHAGWNPFEPSPAAMADPQPPELAMDGSGWGQGE